MLSHSYTSSGGKMYKILGVMTVGYSLFTLSQENKWQEKFKNYTFDSIIQILGYDPAISITPPALGVENGNEVTVYAHAWGDSKDSIQYFRNNSLMLPGTIVGFNFKDAHTGSSLPPAWHSNFAQEGDISTLLSVLNVLIKCGVKRINLFGHSRGGGTILTMLARLYEHTSHTQFFNKLGINKVAAALLLDAIRQGTIVLNCPLVDKRATY